ncbi:hypothetical protein [Pseudoalteromonas sp. OOF1S-7]|uniref:hypothetical protein n=1 Tax=Pseudoalteromonas sp. OOF1S-7 TaxID=2917757 RepID=UPI001EF5DCF4|nr:hypothetical protein [Pseudoalteromonas sp. OOF1S-7]MCG7534774.1 hypothetical protein [Pseudoalteromonas sp. OOF1S-7]
MRKKVLLFALLFSCAAKASTTWIPIRTGQISFVIPYIPKDKFHAPKNIRVTNLSGKKLISWDDVQHASKYLIQVLDKNGVWIDKEIIFGTRFEVPENFSFYYQFRIIACNYTSCNNSGEFSYSYAIEKKVIFIHTDLLGSPVSESMEQ